MGCNVIGSTISAKRSTLLYSGKLGSGTVHLTLKHGPKKSYVYCDGRTPVNGINQPAKLCEGSRKHFTTRPRKVNAPFQLSCANGPSTCRRPGRRICA